MKARPAEWKMWLGVLLVVALFAGLWRLDYVIWRAAHPQAPTWTYFFSGRR